MLKGDGSIQRKYIGLAESKGWERLSYAGASIPLNWAE